MAGDFDKDWGPWIGLAIALFGLFVCTKAPDTFICGIPLMIFGVWLYCRYVKLSSGLP